MTENQPTFPDEEDFSLDTATVNVNGNVLDFKSLFNSLGDMVEDLSKDGNCVEVFKNCITSLEEKYHLIPHLYCRFINDLNVHGHKSKPINERLVGHGKAIEKYYQQQFLPSIGFSAERLESGDFTVAEVRRLPLVKAEERDCYSRFDFSDFLDWTKDQEIHDKYGFLTTKVYNTVVSGVLTKEDLTSVLKTLDRFEQFLSSGMEPDQVSQAMEKIRNILVVKPASMSAAKELFPFKSETILSDLRLKVESMFGSNDKPLDEQYWAQFDN